MSEKVPVVHVRGQLPCTLASLHRSIGVILLLELMIRLIIRRPNLIAQNFLLSTWGATGSPFIGSCGRWRKRWRAVCGTTGAA